MPERTEEYRFHHWRIPSRMMEGIRLYREKGVIPGDFLCAVLKNDFVTALCHADEENLHNIQAYAAYLHMEMPRAAWGSPDNVRRWSARMRAMSYCKGDQVKVVEAGDFCADRLGQRGRVHYFEYDPNTREFLVGVRFPDGDEIAFNPGDVERVEEENKEGGN